MAKLVKMANKNGGNNRNYNVNYSSVGNTRRATSPPPPDDPTTVAGHRCYTKINAVNLNYVWSIDIFSHCPQGKGEPLKSSTFYAGPNDKLQWCMTLYPKGVDEESKDYVSLYCVLVSCSNLDVKANFKVGILNDKQEKTMAMESRNAWGFVQDKGWGFKKFIYRQYLLEVVNGLLPNDKLTIFCEMRPVEDPVNISGQSKTVKFKEPECRLSDDFGVMFESQIIPDVTLAVAGKEYQAHKAVLAARSPVFAAMFRHEMKERIHNRVEITDVDADVLEEMLRFIYAGKSNNMEKMAEDLLAAADRYALEKLKEMCAEALYAGLSVEKATEVFVFADLHSADKLKVQALYFLRTHTNEVMRTMGWNLMTYSHPLLLADAIQTAAT